METIISRFDGRIMDVFVFKDNTKVMQKDIWNIIVILWYEPSKTKLLSKHVFYEVSSLQKGGYVQE